MNICSQSSKHFKQTFLLFSMLNNNDTIMDNKEQLCNLHLLYSHRIIFDKLVEECSLFLKCSFFVEHFIILEKNVFEKEYSIRPRFYCAKLSTMPFMQSKECSEIITQVFDNSGKTDNKEAVVQRCSVKKVFLKISQNSLENTCA